MTHTTDYQQQAIDFCNKTNTTIKVEYLKTGKYFDDDKEERDIYNVTISRGSRSYSFNFGQSIASSGKYVFHSKHYGRNTLKKDRSFLSEEEYKKLGRYFSNDIIKNKGYSIPNEYDILATITKNDPGTFENFCSDFGYDIDSRKAEKIYNAVREEYLQLAALYNEEEMNELQEIN